MMNKQFDLVVLGTGSAASNIAYKCKKGGMKVAVVDCRPYGGTCALRGCDPKKVLVETTEVLEMARRMVGKGISGEGLGIRWKDLIRFKNTFTDPVPQKRERDFEKAGMAIFHGAARFVNRNTVEIGDDRLEGRHIAIATGAKPAPMKIPGEHLLTTSTQFLDLEELPARILFVGGGYISFEFAHIAARSGARVEVLHRGARPLEGFEKEMVAILKKASEELGIQLHLNTAVTEIEKGNGGLRVRASTQGQDRWFEADLVVHGAGRVPEIDELNLDLAEVAWEKNGVVVNEFLQSPTNPAVYAAGDAAASPGPKLTPVAGLEGRIVGTNILKGNRAKPVYEGIPTVVFTYPTLAGVGMKEEEVIEKEITFKVKRGDTSHWYSSRRAGEHHSGYKILIEEKTDRILGAHLLFPKAEEIINLFAVAIQGKIPAGDLKRMVYAFPTWAADIPYML